MAGWVALVQPVLLFMVSVENTMLSMGYQMWNQTKGNVYNLYSSASGNIKSLYGGAQDIASNSYEDVRRRAGSVYEDLQDKAEAKSKSVLEQVGNQIHLVYINTHLKINLALTKLQLHFGILLKDIKTRFCDIFKLNIGLKFRNLQDKTNVKVTKLKKKATENVKGRLQNMSLKAREYEDILEEKLTLFSGSPSPRPLQEGRLTLRRNIASPTASSQSVPDTEVDKVKTVTNLPTGLFSSSDTSAFGSSPSSLSKINNKEQINGKCLTQYSVNSNDLMLPHAPKLMPSVMKFDHSSHNSYRKSHLLRPLNKYMKGKFPSLPDILESPYYEKQMCSNCFTEDITNIESKDKSKMKQPNVKKENSPQIQCCMWKSFSFVGPSLPDKFDCICNDTELEKCSSNETYFKPTNSFYKSIANSLNFDDETSDASFAPDIHTQDQEDNMISSFELTQTENNQTSKISSYLNGFGEHPSDQHVGSSQDYGDKSNNIECTKSNNVETVESCLNSLSDILKGCGEILTTQHSSNQEVLEKTSTINTNKRVGEYSTNTRSIASEIEDSLSNILKGCEEMLTTQHSSNQEVLDKMSTINTNISVGEYSPNTPSTATEVNDLLSRKESSIENKVAQYSHSNYQVMEKDSSADQCISQIVDDGSPVTKLDHYGSCQTHLKYPEIEDHFASHLSTNCKEDDTEVNFQSSQLKSSSIIVDNSSSTVDNSSSTVVDNANPSPVECR